MMQTTSIIFVLIGIIFQFFGVTIQLVEHFTLNSKPVTLEEVAPNKIQSESE